MKRLSIYVVTVCAILVLSITGVVLARSIGKKGTTPYVTHFVFRPLVTVEVPGLGTATALEMTGTTENMEGGTMLHQMSARCVALNVVSGDTKYLDGACVLVDRDGDKIMSRFDSREVDKSVPDRDCGTHFITGGTGKYAGITGKEPYACISMPPLVGDGGYFAFDLPHTTTWEIK